MMNLWQVAITTLGGVVVGILLSIVYFYIPVPAIRKTRESVWQYLVTKLLSVRRLFSSILMARTNVNDKGFQPEGEITHFFIESTGINTSDSYSENLQQLSPDNPGRGDDGIPSGVEYDSKLANNRPALNKNSFHVSHEIENESTIEQNQPHNHLSVFLDEFICNRQIIRELTGDSLSPLNTALWEANQRLVRNMNTDLKNRLTALYNDINLLNSLVWLSNEFNYISPNMSLKYTKLCRIIAINLENLINSIGYATQSENALT